MNTLAFYSKLMLNSSLKYFWGTVLNIPSIKKKDESCISHLHDPKSIGQLTCWNKVLQRLSSDKNSEDHTYVIVINRKVRVSNKYISMNEYLVNFYIKLIWKRDKN